VPPLFKQPRGSSAQARSAGLVAMSHPRALLRVACAPWRHAASRRQ